MKLNLTKNWIAKILSLLLATAIWFLIRDYLLSNYLVSPRTSGADGGKAETRPSEFVVEVSGRDSEGQPILSIKQIPKAKPVSEPH
ncbi:hypothetical protein [Luteolibacter sp. LG18]|uniref:hypothetical protein n=1 Tax=Luteolibacter sp. LG18 TaxID=2819286 RepID=UPI002B2B6115|nr:hypothetical protein llg_04770 [Luteolibacter sp. LG18]